MHSFLKIQQNRNIARGFEWEFLCWTLCRLERDALDYPDDRQAQYRKYSMFYNSSMHPVLSPRLKVTELREAPESLSLACLLPPMLACHCLHR